jgi:hypothetical protein
MPAANKFQTFAGDLAGGVHDLVGSTPGTDMGVVQIYLSNAAPNAGTHSVKADVAEIATGNGYTGATTPASLAGSESAGTFTLSGNAITFTASSGAIATFRYVVLYNDTPTDPADPLMLWWDHGSAVDLADGESFTWRPSGEATGGTILTLA